LCRLTHQFDKQIIAEAQGERLKGKSRRGKVADHLSKWPVRICAAFRQGWIHEA
jgi:hypothetical protein